MEAFFENVMLPLRKYLLEDFIGGPKVLQLRHAINLHKCMTFVFVLSLMAYFDNFTWAPCVYLANHGTYGIVWFLKDMTIPDKNWEKRITYPSLILVFCILCSVYWSAAYIVVAHRVQITPLFATLCIMLNTLGMVLMMCTDTQTHFVLKHKKGLVSDGWVSRSRNTNYLGEIMLYCSFALLSKHWLPFTLFGSIWAFLFTTNIYYKEKSLKKKEGAQEYFQKSSLIIPNLAGWAKDFFGVEAKSTRKSN